MLRAGIKRPNTTLIIAVRQVRAGQRRDPGHVAAHALRRLPICVVKECRPIVIRRHMKAARIHFSPLRTPARQNRGNRMPGEIVGVVLGSLRAYAMDSQTVSIVDIGCGSASIVPAETCCRSTVVSFDDINPSEWNTTLRFLHRDQRASQTILTPDFPGWQVSASKLAGGPDPSSGRNEIREEKLAKPRGKLNPSPPSELRQAPQATPAPNLAASLSRRNCMGRSSSAATTPATPPARSTTT